MACPGTRLQKIASLRSPTTCRCKDTIGTRRLRKQELEERSLGKHLKGLAGELNTQDQKFQVTVDDNGTALKRRTDEPEPVEAPATKHRKQPPLLTHLKFRGTTLLQYLRPPLDPPIPRIQPETTLIWKD
ncbi:hypothetical protein YC2023_093969 [Brassica napus]